MARNVLVLKHFESPKDAGLYFRLVCLTGPNKGESYVLMGNRIVIGRSEKADVRINDTKASREHAEVTKVGDAWVVTDLGSQNGVFINDKKITQESLSEGDKLIVGQTVFKFAKVEVSSKNKVIQEQTTDPGGSRAFLPILVLLLIFAGIFLWDDSSEPKKRKPKENRSNLQDVNNEYITAIQKRQANANKQTKEKLNAIFQRGLRELRERNYYRAIHEFNLALIIAPGDAQAEYYLRKTKEELDKEIEGYTANAQRDEESLKYRNSITSYCAIVRYLSHSIDDPRYKNAVKQINELESKLGMESGESRCFETKPTSK